MPAPNITTERPGVRTERRETMGEKVWGAVDDIVELRLNQAAQRLRDANETPTVQGALELAYIMQGRGLDTVDTDDMTTSTLTANRIALVMLGMPHAQRAETGKKTEEDKIFLSKFNSELAAALAYMPPSMMGDFKDQLLLHSQSNIEERLHTTSMGEEQLNSNLRGVSREVAFWRGAQAELPEDWQMRQSTTEEDLMGVDFVITNPEGNQLCMDVKSAGSFKITLDLLIRKGLLGQTAAQRARDDGYVYAPYFSQDKQKVAGFRCIFDAERLGTIENFEFQDPTPVFEFIEARYADQRVQNLHKLGKTAIVS